MTVRAARLQPKKAAKSPVNGTRAARLDKAVTGATGKPAAAEKAAALSLFDRGEQSFECAKP